MLHHFLERGARQRPEHPFLIEGDDVATYAQVDERANRVAQGLLREGLGRGDRVGLLAPNSRAYVEAYYGILKAGGIAVPFSTASDASLLSAQLRDCGARVLLVVGPRFAKLGAAAAEGAAELRVASPEDFAAGSSGSAPTVEIEPRDPAAIVYTSGSTGKPRGATLSHGNLVANVSSIVAYLGLGADDRVLAILPFPYVYGASILNTHAAAMATVVIENRFAYPNVALDTLESQRCTGFSGVPSTFAILLNRSNLATRSLSHLRYVTQAGGPMAPELTRRLMDALPGKRIFIMYGATEASARLTYLPPERLATKLGSIGKPIPDVQIRLLGDDGRDVAEGEVGEIVASGENIMLGYWGDPEETARVLGPEGYRTGDLAQRDDDGFLYIAGRKKDFIKAGGNRVAAQLVEEAILSFAAIHEAAVIGVPDEILGEAIRAYVVFRETGVGDVKALERHLAARLPSFAVPSQIQVRAELPKNEAGKIMKQVLREDARAGAS